MKRTSISSNIEGRVASLRARSLGSSRRALLLSQCRYSWHGRQSPLGPSHGNSLTATRGSNTKRRDRSSVRRITSLWFFRHSGNILISQMSGCLKETPAGGTTRFSQRIRLITSSEVYPTTERGILSSGANSSDSRIGPLQSAMIPCGDRHQLAKGRL